MNGMLIRGAKVFTDKSIFEELDIRTKGQRILEIGSGLSAGADEMIIDAAGLTAIPGLVDIHFHGAAGHDFCDADPEGLEEIAAYEAHRGVLAVCPATMTYSEEILGGIMDAARRFKEKQDSAGNNTNGTNDANDANGTNCTNFTAGLATLVGINMEGPFISPDKMGAQNPKFLMNPDVSMFKRLQQRSGGLIRLVDIAPELEGASEFIRECGDEVTISIAHTMADYDTAVRAFEAGVHHVTHLFNAMPGLSHRSPGPIAAAVEYGAETEIIADSVHVHPAMVRLAFKCFGTDKMILISDSMEATGLADGQYSLGGQAVTKCGNLAVLTEHEETIAGSVTDLYDCLKTAVQVCGIRPEDAIQAAALNPAASIGIDGDYGSIAVGKYANIILTDDEWNIIKVINRGSVL